MALLERGDMRNRFSIALLAIVSSLGAAAAPAVASPITVTFTGTVTSFDPDPFGGLVLPMAVSGSYTFDPATPPRDTLFPDQRVYDALLSLTVNLGSYGPWTSTAPLEIQIDNGTATNGLIDRYAVVSRASDGLHLGPGGTGIPGYQILSFAFALFDTTNNNPFDSPDLPTNVDLSKFGASFLGLNFVIDEDPAVNGVVTSLNFPAATVPEPTSMLLLGSGVAALALRRRRNG
jgi:hypothetical protein